MPHPKRFTTAREVDALRPPPGVPRAEFLDAVVAGLSLRVTARGVKSWAVRYRHRKTLRRYTLGRLDQGVTLAAARTRARDILRAAEAGADPAAEKLQGRTAQTFGELADLYIEQHAKKRKRSWPEDDRRLRNVVVPVWRHRAIVDLKRADVRALLDDVAARAPVEANRILALVRKMFNFAISRDLIEHNPAQHVGKPGKERKGERVLTDDELRSFWRGCDRVDRAFAALFKLRLLTAQRLTEVRNLRWEETDLVGKVWTIPSDRTKNGLPHRVPLTASAIAILKTLDPQSKGLILVGARGKRQAATASKKIFEGMLAMRGHDLRRTAASRMASEGVARLTISKVLNHVEPGVTAVYDRHGYDAEKREALDAWDRAFHRLLAAKPTRTIAPDAPAITVASDGARGAERRGVVRLFQPRVAR